MKVFGRRRRVQSIGGIVMEGESPELGEISLGCEINGYANAELSVSNSKAPVKK
jgi:hypothetical protein